MISADDFMMTQSEIEDAELEAASSGGFLWSMALSCWPYENVCKQG